MAPSATMPMNLCRAAKEAGILYNTGEGGLHRDLYQYGSNTIVQVASGRFGVHKDYLEAGAAIEIKMGQGAKARNRRTSSGNKDSRDISRTEWFLKVRTPFLRPRTMILFD